MPDHVILLSVPGLRAKDLELMPHLQRLTATGEQAKIVPSFPGITLPVEVNMTTGRLPDEHGVVCNGFYDRAAGQLEMWTAWNEAVQRPQIWDVLHEKVSGATSAVWFPMLAKGCGADYISTPAPIHNPDGTESLWCYTRPEDLYGELRDELGHFPLHHFWGPLSNISSSQWIVDSAVVAAKRWKPNFFYIYLPQLDYAGQKFGPDSAEQQSAVVGLDGLIGRLSAGFQEAYGTGTEPLYMIASEYVITPVEHVTYPNRILRELDLLTIQEVDGGEILDVANSPAWALADHQIGHIFVKDSDPHVIQRVVELFRGKAGFAEVLSGAERGKYNLIHPRSGDVILVSAPNSWQAYYYWLDDDRAPAFARTVDIHRKPGYDPVEMFLDMKTKSTPLDATLVKGSHGAPALTDGQRGLFITSQPGVVAAESITDTDVFDLVMHQFGI